MRGAPGLRSPIDEREGGGGERVYDGPDCSIDYIRGLQGYTDDGCIVAAGESFSDLTPAFI